MGEGMDTTYVTGGLATLIVFFCPTLVPGWASSPRQAGRSRSAGPDTLPATSTGPTALLEKKNPSWCAQKKDEDAKANVVASVWEEEFVKFFAALAVSLGRF